MCQNILKVLFFPQVKEFPEKGRGVVTTKALKRGDYVMEYYGELIDYEEALRRESIYATKENTGCYMYYFKSLDKRYWYGSFILKHFVKSLLTYIDIIKHV